MPRPNRGRPNVVMIVGDNHGRGAVGCYSTAVDFETPHIDRLAREGMRFSRFFCANASCSGSRATLLTGLLPSQHGVHSWLQDTMQDGWPGGWYAVGEFRTLPATLQARGYSTAHVGKWHLGTPWVRPTGFDSWVSFGVGDTLDFYDNEVVVDGERSRLTGRRVVDFFSEQAVRRLRELRDAEPFFLSVWYDGPYAFRRSTPGASRSGAVARRNVSPGRARCRADNESRPGWNSVKPSRSSDAAPPNSRVGRGRRHGEADLVSGDVLPARPDSTRSRWEGCRMTARPMRWRRSRG